MRWRCFAMSVSARRRACSASRRWRSFSAIALGSVGAFLRLNSRPNMRQAYLRPAVNDMIAHDKEGNE